MTQLTLHAEWVDLTTEERAERGRELAAAYRARQVLDEEHAERKLFMKQEIQAAERRIAELARIVGEGREERPVAR